MTEILSLFPATYAASRARFRENLALIRQFWPQAQLFQHRLPGEQDLTIDWIYADALENNAKGFIFTIGEHGVEGYVGSAMQQRFCDCFLPRLNPQNTGLLMVHAINPWGMHHHRRVNANNVDLNRNFVYEGVFDPNFNPNYDKVNSILNPPQQIQSLKLSNLKFFGRLIWLLTRLGPRGFKHATLLGQYRNPKGLYYGGTGYQEETGILMGLYRQVFSAYDQILHLDMHTGYGPRYQMSLVNSGLETKSSAAFVEAFKYPLVVAANPNEFYALQGDMIDFVYALHQNEFPQKRLFATSFEFGTLGDELFGLVHSPRAMIHENRLHWYNTPHDLIRKQIQRDFEELFNPSASDWKAKAVADADLAFEGILSAEGFF